MIPFGAVSYGSAALAFLALTFLVLTRWRHSLHGWLLTPASFVGAVWAAALAWQSYAGRLPLTAVFAIEIVRDTVWLAALVRIFRAIAGRSLPPWASRSVYGVSIGVLLLGITIGVLHDAGFAVDSAGAVLIPGALLLAMLGFVFTQQVFANSSQGRPWAFKFLWMGIGGMFAYDLFLYSVALMLRGVVIELWDARGVINAMLVTILGVGLARAVKVAPALSMSHRFVFYTSSLISVGIYLLAMAIAGLYIKSVGGTWGGAIQVVFLFGAVLILAVMLLSGQVRAWARVFLTKSFFPYKYDHRNEWLRLTQTLATDLHRPLSERAIAALAAPLNCVQGGLWICRDGTFIPSGGDFAGPDMPGAPADSEFLRYVSEQEWIVDLDEERQRGPQPPLRPPAPDWLLGMEKAWLVIPLLQEHRLVGFVVIGRPLAGQALTWEDLDLLRVASRQVAAFVSLAEAADELARSQQFAAYNRLTAFMMHDLKNLAAQQTLVIQNAARHKHNPDFIDDAISTIENSVRRMNRMLEQLKRGDAGGPARRVRIAAVCAEALQRCAGRAPEPQVTALDEGIEVETSPDRLAVALEHIVRNAQDATPADGEVRIELRAESREAVIDIVDNGSGMNAEFIRDRLFRPFDTTKGNQGMGIGAYQAREFIRACGGTIDVESEVGQGTRFSIRLPLAATAR
jgi:putative PEP-CTERM system histidine kinase